MALILPPFEPGFRLIDGTQLNLLVSRLNGIANTALVVGQAAPTALTTSALLTAAQLLNGLFTANQGAAGAAAYQLPLAASMNTTFPTILVNQAFDFSLINISTVAAEAASITTNTGWTLVGDMDVQANNTATTKSAGRFRARKVTATTWSLYRLS